MASYGFFLYFSGGQVSHSLCFLPFPSSMETESFRGVSRGFNVSVVLLVSPPELLCVVGHREGFFHVMFLAG